MNVVSNNFVIIYEDYMIATGDVAMSAIVAVIERLSTHNTGKLDSWVKINAKTIEIMTVGIVAKRTVSKKIEQLRKLGLIEIKNDENNWPHYRIIRHELEKIVLSKRSAYTPVAYTPSTPAAYTSTPAAYTLYASSVDIKNNIKNTNEETLKHTTSLIDKEKSSKEEDLNQDVRTLLKAYDKIPKNKRDRFCRGSLNALYKNYGDSLERISTEYGVDSCLLAMEKFKQDEYWSEKGFPLRGFMKQIERYLENASDKPEGYHRVAKTEKTAGRPESSQMEAVQDLVQQPAFDSTDREFLRKKVRRVDVVMNMLEQTIPESLAEFKQETADIGSVAPERIEYWYQLASLKWRETRGVYEPTGGTRPLC